MRMFGLVLAALWIVFAAIWLVSAFNTKGYAQKKAHSLIAHFSALLVIVAVLRVRFIRHFFAGIEHAIWTPALASIGLVLVGLGIGFAVWARVQLGRNWGTPMSLKQNPELITGGPYEYVRHPIYGGILVAMLGSTLVSIWWIVALVLLTAYFVWSANTEEKIMTAQFPQRYPGYAKRSKMFIPFIF